jgi:hypothetical protein
MDERAERAVYFDGRDIGHVAQRWVRTEPHAWAEQWDLIGEPVCFDTYEDACAYLVERYERERVAR